MPANLFYMILVLLSLGIAGCGGRHIENVVVRGSDTEVNLVLHLAETYMDSVPNVSIAVTGGGSGTGIASLINRKTDIANSSRPFLEAELKLAKERGVEVGPLVFAVDALAFIVHPQLPIDSLSVDEVRGLFTGEYPNWSRLGGPDLTVNLYGRQSNSGTYIYVRNELLGADYSNRLKQMNGSSQIVESIRKDLSGVGYVGLGYVLQQDGTIMEGIKILSIRADEHSPAISPQLKTTITDGLYPVIRPLYQYVDGWPQGQKRAFIEFELSEAGQRIVAENGYFPVGEAYREKNNKLLANE